VRRVVAIVENVTGEAVPNADITVRLDSGRDLLGRSDESGEWEEIIPPGDRVVSVRVDGASLGYTDCFISVNRYEELQREDNIVPTVRVTAHLRHAARLVVTATDKGGTPQPYFRFVLSCQEKGPQTVTIRYGLTKAFGPAEVDGLDPVRWRFVSDEWRNFCAVEGFVFDLSPGEVHRIDLELEPIPPERVASGVFGALVGSPIRDDGVLADCVVQRENSPNAYIPVYPDGAWFVYGEGEPFRVRLFNHVLGCHTGWFDVSYGEHLGDLPVSWQD